MTARVTVLLPMLMLALVLLVAQTLGLLHRIVHSPEAAHFHIAASSDVGPAKATHARNGNAAHGFLAHLFIGHLDNHSDHQSEGEPDTHPDRADCRAYDQLSHFDAAPGCVALALPLVLTPFLLATLAGLAVARWHALFQARGPPSLR
jgi:hypothetical protein